MGMYDTLGNGYQVKCFNMAYCNDGKVYFSGGRLRYFEIGSAVPYKQPHYNYGKNFLILEVDRFVSDYCDYDFVIHEIKDGKYCGSYEDVVPDLIDWNIISCVVSYWGEKLNIFCKNDVHGFINAEQQYIKDYDKTRENYNKIFKEWGSILHDKRWLSKEQLEHKELSKKLSEIQERLNKEDKKIDQILKELKESYYKRWFITDPEDIITLGNWISAYETEKRVGNDNLAKECYAKIMNIINYDNDIIRRYVDWQGSDNYVKEFM